MMVLLVHFLAPLAAATYLAVAFRRGGGRRLWRDAALLSGALAAFSLWQRDIVFYFDGPLSAAGVATWPFFPVAALVAAAAVHVLARCEVPAALCAAPAAVLGSLIIRVGYWIA